MHIVGDRNTTTTYSEGIHLGRNSSSDQEIEIVTNGNNGSIHFTKVGDSDPDGIIRYRHDSDLLDFLVGGDSIMSASSNTLTVNGETSSASFNATSDRRKKENICVLENPLEKICQIRGVNFTFIDDKDEHKQKHAGIIAQEVDSIIPEVVCKKNDDLWTANYNSLIAYLIESVKTLKHENDTEKQKVATLESQLASVLQRLDALENK